MRRALVVAALVLLPLSAVASNTPKSAIFHDPTTHETCGPSGDADSPEPALNRQKNRIEPTPRTEHKTVAQFRALPTPDAAPRATRDQWSDDDAKHVAQIETTPVHVIGYLVGRAREHEESTNCGADDAAGVDTHTWLVDSTDEHKKTSIVAEVTPRWRLANPSWSPSALQALVEQGAQLRISGWPMFDEDHPEQLKKTRATLWEIHPITDIEVNTNGGWVELGENDALIAIRNTGSVVARTLPRRSLSDMLSATMSLQPLSMQPSPRARRFGALHLVNTRAPQANARIITEERELIKQDAALGSR